MAAPTTKKPATPRAAKPAPASDVELERPVHRPDPKQVRPGHLMAFTHYVNVEQARNDGASLTVRDLDDGTQFVVDGTPLVERAASADLFTETRKVTKTRLAEILIESHNRPICVSWLKDDGNERTLRGRFISHEKLMGRSHVEDLELPPTERNRLRLVSHRTLIYLVVDGVRYEAKT